MKNLETRTRWRDLPLSLGESVDSIIGTEDIIEITKLNEPKAVIISTHYYEQLKSLADA